MVSKDKLAYYIALNRISNIGARTARNIILNINDIESVFTANAKTLIHEYKLSSRIADSIIEYRNLDDGKKELDFINENNINIVSYFDEDYPRRLKNCIDAPLLLFWKGCADWNKQQTVAIVGTRKASSYGQVATENLISEMAKNGGYTVISGLAYGIDTIAHRACLKHNVATWGVLAHGLDIIYPARHKDVSNSMLANGALITEFSSNSGMNSNNFLSRNRIIAGLADCTIVVESAEKGGSLVTADIANSYNRDVFAFPGRSIDKYSIGCNNLIRRNQAHLIQQLSDLEYVMNWDIKQRSKPIQRSMFIELTNEEKLITSNMSNEPIFIDDICAKSKITMGKTLSILFSLEMKGVVRMHVGKMYSLI